MLKLNVGGGKGHPKVGGWTIVDLRETADLRLDISKDPLPYADGSVDVIFTSHTLEHIQLNRLGFVLEEFRRVIRPGRKTEQGFQGGILRVLVPDIQQACRAYVAGDRSFFQKAELTYHDPEAPLGGLLASWFFSISDVGNGHCHCFDAPYLKYLLEKHGFTHTDHNDFGKSVMPELRGAAFDRRPHASLCMDAWTQEDAA
jgi:hypothetical protein